jgi:hypothetical protein
MSAALKSYVPRPVPTQRRSSQAQMTQPHSGSAAPAVRQPQVSPPTSLPTALSRSDASPMLQSLAKLQLVSSTLAIALVLLALLSYGVSVYVSRQLSHTNQQLSRLQRSGQQLTTANEVLKHHLAQQAQIGELGFQPPQPDRVIFLKPAQQAAVVAQPSPAPKAVFGWLTVPQIDVPLGY